MELMGTTAADYRWAVFHQPNVKFPERAAKMLGFSKEQIAPGLLSGRIGNTYSGCMRLGGQHAQAYHGARTAGPPW